MQGKAVAWDIDGTLVDSEGLHHRALVEVSRHYGADLADLTGEAFQGVHMRDVWLHLRPLFPPELARDEWLAAIDSFYIEHAHALLATPHARETIHALRARGIAQACVSNSSRQVVDANLAVLGVGNALAFSLSLDDVARGKPDPEPYRLTATRLGVAAPEIVAVEDSAAGAASARAAGMFVVRFAPGGVRSGAADAWISNLSELVAWVGRPRA